MLESQPTFHPPFTVMHNVILVSPRPYLYIFSHFKQGLTKYQENYLEAISLSRFELELKGHEPNVIPDYTTEMLFEDSFL